MFFVSRFFILVALLPSLIIANSDDLLTNQQMKEVTLKNGLRICLKRTDYEEGAFVFQMFAMGGYAAAPVANRPSAAFAGAIAWESGLQDASSDKIAYELYQRSLEMNVSIRLFDRVIEASGLTEDLSYCLELIQALFRAPQFTFQGLERVISESKILFQDHSQETIKDCFLKTNTQNWDVLTSLTCEDLKKVKLEQAEAFFKQAFADPSLFTLILVGDFDFNNATALLEKHLGCIEARSSAPLINPEAPHFPQGVTKREIKGYARNRLALTRLTFPVIKKELSSLNFICHILSARLLDHFSAVDSQTQFEVHYEFPLFPRLDHIWLIVQFYGPTTTIHSTTQSTLKIIHHLNRLGLSEQERKSELEISNSCEEDNIYLLSLLSNCYHGGWDSTLIDSKHPIEIKHKGSENILDSYIHLDHYSLISLYP
ncbi:putative metalloprotease [Candidatus Protochlamydia naegleriophila]|uniref:Putative metalloprotease n=1 Tax=Candidatus Protochlamydia naegleriophila TaxID=389348 RepID=A0A0U5JGM3_9BACT|nr:insulinase family protein [Candidatus Protochlamydia naegleriophila]CUI17077.1 putative metalloprotease [Candidatus Protochlamydia naegleriophila]